MGKKSGVAIATGVGMAQVIYSITGSLTTHTEVKTTFVKLVKKNVSVKFCVYDLFTGQKTVNVVCQ